MLKRPTFYLALLGIFAISTLVIRLRKPDPTPQPMVEPSRTPYERSVGARGIVESRDENVRIAPTVAGRIAKVFVKIGDLVKTGDPLFQVDAREAEAIVHLQEVEVAVRSAKVREAEVKVAERLDRLNRTRNLLTKKAISEDEAQRDEFALQAATSALESAKADLDQGKASLDKARVDLSLHRVESPRDGKVLYMDLREGEYAAANPSNLLMLVGDIDRLQLRADVDEDNASNVVSGAPAVAFLKGFRSEAIPLEFVRIDPYILPKRSLTGESTERVDTRVLQVIYQFKNPSYPVYVGQQMDVFIQNEKPL